jgi:hypothetical protein
LSILNSRLRAAHAPQLLQPDVVAAIQEDVVQQLQQLSSVLSVAGSALASVGRSLNL